MLPAYAPMRKGCRGRPLHGAASEMSGAQHPYADAAAAAPLRQTLSPGASSAAAAASAVAAGPECCRNTSTVAATGSKSCEKTACPAHGNCASQAPAARGSGLALGGCACQTSLRMRFPKLQAAMVFRPTAAFHEAMPLPGKPTGGGRVLAWYTGCQLRLCMGRHNNVLLPAHLQPYSACWAVRGTTMHEHVAMAARHVRAINGRKEQEH